MPFSESWTALQSKSNILPAPRDDIENSGRKATKKVYDTLYLSKCLTTTHIQRLFQKNGMHVLHPKILDTYSHIRLIKMQSA